MKKKKITSCHVPCFSRVSYGSNTVFHCISIFLLAVRILVVLVHQLAPLVHIVQGAFFHHVQLRIHLTQRLQTVYRSHN